MIAGNDLILAKILGVLLLFSAAGCSSDIAIFGEPEPAPVVFCLLNQGSGDQYLRLSKTYQTNGAWGPPEHSDSLVIPKDSYVAVEEVIDDTVTHTYVFEPCDLDRDIGFFPPGSTGTWYSHFEIDQSATYRLIIDIQAWDYLIYSTVKPVSEYSLVDPAYPEVRQIHLVEDHNPVVRWTRGLNASVYQLGLRLKYIEFFENRSCDKELIVRFFTAFYREDPGSFYSYTINSNQFYKRVGEEMTVDTLVLRQLLSVSAFVVAGSEAVGFYLNSLERGDPFQLFEYGNVVNGVGIFGAYQVKESGGFQLDGQSLDSLAYGTYTRQLNFLDRDGHRK